MIRGDVVASVNSALFFCFSAADFQFGRGVFPSSESEVFKCHSFSFSPLFTSDDIHVQITQYNADNTKRYTYEAAVGWVEQITKAGFTSCSVCSGERGTQTLKFDWMAYVGTPSGTETGRFSVPMFTTGTECSTVYFKTVSKRCRNTYLHIKLLHKRLFNKYTHREGDGERDTDRQTDRQPD